MTSQPDFIRQITNWFCPRRASSTRSTMRLAKLRSVETRTASCYTRGPSRIIIRARNGGLQVGLHADRARARHGSSVQRRGAARRVALDGVTHRLYRLRLHGGLPAYRFAAADHDAALVAEDRPQGDRADGRRHDQGWRPFLSRRSASAAW